MLLISGYLSAQTDTVIYYSKMSNPVDSKKDAFSYDVLTKISENHFELTKYQDWNGKWKEDFKTQIWVNSDTSLILINLRNKFNPDTTLRYFHKIDSGFSIVEFKDSVLISEGNSSRNLPLIKKGNWKYYDRINGRLDREESYVNNRMITNKIWINDSSFVTDVFQITDKMPEYNGGQIAFMNYLSSHLIYPKFAMDNGIQGTVFIQFIITESGQMKGAKILRGVEKSLNDEALRVINSVPNNWTPGKIDDKNVNVFMNIPINFKLQ
jgi:TonB family protein